MDVGEETFWNGEPVFCRKVLIVVGDPGFYHPNSWVVDIVGQEREAVEVTRPGEGSFYLDNEDGSGWRKVTVGKGSPAYGHRNLPAAQVIEGRRP